MAEKKEAIVLVARTLSATKGDANLALELLAEQVIDAGASELRWVTDAQCVHCGGMVEIGVGRAFCTQAECRGGRPV